MWTFKDTPHTYEFTFIGWNCIEFVTHTSGSAVREGWSSKYADEYLNWMFEPELGYDPRYGVLLF